MSAVAQPACRNRSWSQTRNFQGELAKQAALEGTRAAFNAANA